MRLLLIIAILLFRNPTATEQLKRCWDDYVQGHCRKICKATEIREIFCANGRYCCLSIKDVKARKVITRAPRPKPRTQAYTFPQDQFPTLENYAISNAHSA